MLLKGRVLSAWTSLRAAYYPQAATAVLREAQSVEEAASNFLQSHLQALRAPFSAQPAYASDEDSEPEVAMEPRPITPDTRHALPGNPVLPAPPNTLPRSIAIAVACMQAP